MSTALVEARLDLDQAGLADHLERLASMRGWTVQEALDRALHTGVERELEYAEKMRKLREIQDEIARLPELAPGFTDKDLYDEDGLPVL